MDKRIPALLNRLARGAEELLYPPDVLCLCCDAALGPSTGEGLCPACREALEALGEREEARERALAGEELPEGLDYVHAAYPYEAQARRLIHRLKFESVRDAAVPLAAAMAYLPSGEEEAIVPIPTDWRRKRQRGFDQAALLAGLLSRTLGMPVWRTLLRTERRAPQTSLSAERRRTNLVGCMRAGEIVRGRRVLLVDDVYTTGSTAREAARALREAGALGVGMFAAARAGGDNIEPADAVLAAMLSVKCRGHDKNLVKL